MKRGWKIKRAIEEISVNPDRYEESAHDKYIY